MALSNNSDGVARFWHKYRIVLQKAGVADSALKCYVRHAQAYVSASAGRRLATHSAPEIEAWLAERGRIDGSPAWQHAQAIDAVHHLLLLARASAAAEVDWKWWRESKTLPVDHPTIARNTMPVSRPPVAPADATEAFDPSAQLVAVIRQRNYSIRTEKAYLDWLKRFARFIGGADPRTAGAAEVKAFLQYLAFP